LTNACFALENMIFILDKCLFSTWTKGVNPLDKKEKVWYNIGVQWREEMKKEVG